MPGFIGAPCESKADGLAAGKGDHLATPWNRRIRPSRKMIMENRFRDAGATVVVEECLTGEEASFIMY